MLLSEKLLFNTADRYIVKLSGFDLHRISEFDDEYQEILGSVFIHLCSLVSITDYTHDSFSETIVPAEKMNELREKIDTKYNNMDQKARTTFWSIVSVLLWTDSHGHFCDILYEKRYKDPIMGEAFKALDEIFRRRNNT